jgi:hypothetical protein
MIILWIKLKRENPQRIVKLLSRNNSKTVSKSLNNKPYQIDPQTWAKTILQIQVNHKIKSHLLLSRNNSKTVSKSLNNKPYQIDPQTWAKTILQIQVNHKIKSHLRSLILRIKIRFRSPAKLIRFFKTIQPQILK